MPPLHFGAKAQGASLNQRSLSLSSKHVITHLTFFALGLAGALLSARHVVAPMAPASAFAFAGMRLPAPLQKQQG